MAGTVWLTAFSTDTIMIFHETTYVLDLGGWTLQSFNPWMYHLEVLTVPHYLFLYSEEHPVSLRETYSVGPVLVYRRAICYEALLCNVFRTPHMGIFKGSWLSRVGGIQIVGPFQGSFWLLASTFYDILCWGNAPVQISVTYLVSLHVCEDSETHW